MFTKSYQFPGEAGHPGAGSGTTDYTTGDSEGKGYVSLSPGYGAPPSGPSGPWLCPRAWEGWLPEVGKQRATCHRTQASGRGGWLQGPGLLGGT